MLQDLTETEPGHGGANLFIQSQTQTPSLLLAPPFTLTFAQTSQSEIKIKAFISRMFQGINPPNKYPSRLHVCYIYFLFILCKKSTSLILWKTQS